MDNFKKYILPVLILLFYVLEGVSKYYLISDNTKIEITRYLRLLIFIYVFIYFVYKRKYTFFIVPIILFLFFLMGQYAMSFSYFNFELIIVFSKYLFVLFLLEFSYEYFKNNNNKFLFKAFDLIIIINSILIILGVLFKIRLFKTYSGERFGYDGLFITSATATYFYMIALFYVFVNYFKSKPNYTLSSLVIIAVFIIGTKAIYLFSALLIVFYFIYYRSSKNLLKSIVISILFLSTIAISLLVFVPSFLEINNTYGLLSAVLSYRDLLFIDKSLPFIRYNWHMLNYLLGGQGFINDRTQMGFLDLFVFFGVFGSAIYLFIYYKVLFKNTLNINSIFIIISFGIVIFLGGNFFYSATITFYLIILQQILYDFSDKSILKHKNA